MGLVYRMEEPVKDEGNWIPSKTFIQFFCPTRVASGSGHHI